jgi:hypothetical protein
MYYKKIEGCEINPEQTFNDFGRIYINEGVFETEKSKAKFEATAVPFKCNEWIDEGYTRINVYYNPDKNKLSLTPENYSAPNESWGYHLGGITLRQSDEFGNCLDQILLPDNGEVEHQKFFNYEYDEAYWHLYHSERPENIFDEGFTPGFDQTPDGEQHNPTPKDILNSLI